MASYRYRPEGNRTPVNDPVLGHLDYDGVYTDERCADDPRFEEIKDEKPGKAAKQAAGSDDKPAADEAPEAGKPAGDSK